MYNRLLISLMVVGMIGEKEFLIYTIMCAFLTKNKCLGKNLNANLVYVRILIEEELRLKFLKHDAVVGCVINIC